MLKSHFAMLSGHYTHTSEMLISKRNICLISLLDSFKNPPPCSGVAWTGGLCMYPPL